MAKTQPKVSKMKKKVSKINRISKATKKEKTRMTRTIKKRKEQDKNKNVQSFLVHINTGSVEVKGLNDRM